jgi:hypothetical protein
MTVCWLTGYRVREINVQKRVQGCRQSQGDMEEEWRRGGG